MIDPAIARRRTRRRLRGLLVSSIAVGFLVACQVIVPSDVPDFKCDSADPSACPSGTVCDTTRSICVSTTGPGGEGGAIDGRIDGPLRDINQPDQKVFGAPCSKDTDCPTNHYCGFPSIVTADVLKTAAPSCTKTCCSSDDCPSGSVCYATGSGSNWCVSAVAAERDAPKSGGKQGGVTCLGNQECRSGLCSNGRCLDTCCNSTTCAGGTVCRVVSGVQGPGAAKHNGWFCAVENDGGVLSGSTCGNPLECKNHVCFEVCSPPCCGPNDCESGGIPGGACAYTSGTDRFRACFQPNSIAKTDNGNDCDTNSKCKSQFCDVDKRCASVCCIDTDCQPGEQCLPNANGALRCVKR